MEYPQFTSDTNLVFRMHPAILYTLYEKTIGYQLSNEAEGRIPYEEVRSIRLH
jgi:hypothetical protein